MVQERKTPAAGDEPFPAEDSRTFMSPAHNVNETMAMDPPSGGEPGVFSPGDHIAARYRVIRYLGRGGVGEVYEVEDEELHGRVALKTLRADTAIGAEATARFKREIQLARKVTHPNICRIYDMGHHDLPPEGGQAGKRIAFLTMELLSGESLTDRIHRLGRLSPKESLPIIRQLTAALEAAHALGIVHRDFKGSNVMLVAGPSGECRAVVTDFGLARPTEGADVSMTFKTCSSSVLGTPAYISPEQLDGGPVTPAVDIYALGIVIYEMLTGTLPFSGDTPIATMVKRLVEPPQRPTVHVPNLDPRWEAVLLRCLEKDPARRFHRAAEVAAALEHPPGPTDTATVAFPRPGSGDTDTATLVCPFPGPPPSVAPSPVAPPPVVAHPVAAPPAKSVKPKRAFLYWPLLLLLAVAVFFVARGLLRSSSRRNAAPPESAQLTPQPAPEAPPAPGNQPASPGVATVPAPPDTATTPAPPPAGGGVPASGSAGQAAGSTSGSLATKAAETSAQGEIALHAARTAEAVKLFQEAASLFEQAGDKTSALRERLRKADGLYRLGLLSECSQVVSAVLQDTKDGAHPAERAEALRGQGWVYLCRGKLTEAAAAFSKSAGTCPPGDAGRRAAARLGTACTNVYQGSPAEAAASAKALAGEFRSLRRPADEASAWVVQARAFLATKDYPQAASAAATAANVARGQDLYTRMGVKIVGAAAAGLANADEKQLAELDALRSQAASAGFALLRIEAGVMKALLALHLKHPLVFRDILPTLETEARTQGLGIVILQLQSLRQRVSRPATETSAAPARSEPPPQPRLRPRLFRP